MTNKTIFVVTSGEDCQVFTDLKSLTTYIGVSRNTIYNRLINEDFIIYKGWRIFRTTLTKSNKGGLRETNNFGRN